MKFYLAPLEGITGYVYRNAFHDFFGGMEKYFTPFISPTSNHNFKGRDKRDVLPENNVGISVVPQILTNQADAFLYTAERLAECGYTEINLNLGCPSGTVVSKGRGSGFLAKTEELNRFLEEIFDKTPVPLSIKTRIGKDSPEEFVRILDIYNQYPVKELTIHPRIQKDYYRNHPNLEVFTEALLTSKNPVCYNGDINSIEDYRQFHERFPQVNRIMLGRGMIRNPGLVREIQGEPAVTWSELMAFHDRLFAEYREIMPEVPLLYKMKEVWSYMHRCHEQPEKIWKMIRKSKHIREYETVIRTIR